MIDSTNVTVMDSSELNFYPPTSEFTLPDVTKSLNSTIAPDIYLPAIDMNVNLVCKIAGLFVVNLLVVIGNILILLAVCTDRALRTVTSYFIVNLAVADLLLGALVLPFAGTYQIMGRWVFGEFFCVIWAATDVLCCTASIYGLCCISIDRYIGVTRPLKHHLIMTKKKALLTIGFSWACSFGVASGPLFGWRPARNDPEQCPMSDSVDYVLFSTSCSFYIPLVIVVIMYYRIYREVVIQTKGLKAGQKTSVIANEGAGSVTLRIHVSISANRKTTTNKSFVKSRSFSQKVALFNRQKRAAKTLGLVVGGFIICWFPFFFVFPFSKICTSCVSPKVFQTCVWLGYCNSFLNPFIYAYSNQSFRNAFRRLLMCQCSKTGLYKSRQRDLRKINNIHRYTAVDNNSESPILSPSKYQTLSKRPNHVNVMQLETVSQEPKSSRRQGRFEHRDVLHHILEQEVESSLTDDQQSSLHEQKDVDQHGTINEDRTPQIVDELSKKQTLHLNGNIYTNDTCTDVYPSDIIINNADSNNSSSCDEDDDCAFINNLQNMERFFDESTRIYSNFLQTRSSHLPQKGRRPSAPSAHISVFVETIGDSKLMPTRRGSYFV